MCRTLRAVLYQQVLLKIVIEMILGSPDGFQRKQRHLSRAASLGGEAVATPEPPKIEDVGEDEKEVSEHDSEDAS